MPEVHSDDRDDVPAFSWFLHWKLPEPRLSWLKIRNQWRPRVRAYLASISFMDSQVGRLLDALDATGRAHETEELYDHRADPHEWKNLASDPRSAEIKHDHTRWLPAGEAQPAPGSATRFLNRLEGIWYWEGEAIVLGEGSQEPVRPKKPGESIVKPKTQ